MAYGVKFRLEFSDDNLKGKKIEILKDGYSGSVLPLVGTENPLQITWDQDDDFYNPIIGSTCQINLFVTDNTNYDDFYTADEREYKIKISYKDSSDVYQTYWEGWLLVDQFQEAVTIKPFAITLKAFDGLGSLDGFTQPLDFSVDPIVFIGSILNNLNLGFSFYVSNDIQRSGASSGNNILDQSSVSSTNFFTDGVDPRDCKEVLELILKFSNSRIFQSYGRWYIINNSSYSEQSVKDSSATTANGGTIPTGIRASETSSLQTNGTESIKYDIYNSSGVYQSSSTVNVLSSVPTNLQPLNNNLVKEYLRPLKEYVQEVDMIGRFSSNIIDNSGFEFGTTSWTLTNSSVVDDFSFQGDKSLKTTTVVSSAGSTSVIAVNSYVPEEVFNENIAYKLKINSFLDSTSAGSSGFRFQIKLESFVIPTDPPVADRYWSESANSWVTASTINEVDIVNARRWKSYNFNIDSLPNENVIHWKIKLFIYGPHQSVTTGFTAMFYDSIILEEQYIDTNNNRSDMFQKFDLLQYVRKRTANVSGVKKLDNLVLTNARYDNVFGEFFRSRDKTNFLKSVEEITSQQVMNDFRDFLVRYEGDLYNNNNDPIGPHNKVWINFGTSILQEPVSCYIDSMTYDVKRNLYSVVMHIPNQDDDITSDFIIKF
jgi:hypothetical protein